MSSIGGSAGRGSAVDRLQKVSQHPLSAYMDFLKLELIKQGTPPIDKDMFEPLHKYFERCIKHLENLEDTATGVTEDDEYNTIDGINIDEHKPVEIKYMSNFGKENKLKIHISVTQIKALEEGGMVLNDGWRVREGNLPGVPSNEGELIIGGFDGDNIHYVKIPHSRLESIFPGILISL